MGKKNGTQNAVYGVKELNEERQFLNKLNSFIHIYMKDGNKTYTIEGGKELEFKKFVDDNKKFIKSTRYKELLGGRKTEQGLIAKYQETTPDKIRAIKASEYESTNESLIASIRHPFLEATKKLNNKPLTPEERANNAATVKAYYSGGNKSQKEKVSKFITDTVNLFVDDMIKQNINVDAWAKYTFGDLSKVAGKTTKDKIANYLEDKNYSSPRELVFHLKLNSLIDPNTKGIKSGKMLEFQKLIDKNKKIVGDGDKINLLNNKFKNNKITALIKDRPFAGFGVKVRDKKGGMHKSDPLGGIYVKGDKEYLLKRNTKHPEHDIAEFLTAAIMNEVSPNSCYEITLGRARKGLRKGEFVQRYGNKERKTYLIVKMTEGVKEFSKKMEGDKRHPRRERSVAKNRGPKSENIYDTHHLENSDIQGYEQAFAARMLLGDFSAHSGSFGSMPTQNGGKETYINTNLGSACNKQNFGTDIHPFRSIKNRFGQEQNYYRRDHPRKKIFSKEFSAELKRIAKIDIEPIIKSSWEKVCKNYNEITIDEFAEQIGDSSTITKDEVRDSFLGTMQCRQISLLMMALEIDIHLALSKETEQEQKTALKKVFSDSTYHNYSDDLSNRASDLYYAHDIVNKPEWKSQMLQEYDEDQKNLVNDVIREAKIELDKELANKKKEQQQKPEQKVTKENKEDKEHEDMHRPQQPPPQQQAQGQRKEQQQEVSDLKQQTYRMIDLLNEAIKDENSKNVTDWMSVIQKNEGLKEFIGEEQLRESVLNLLEEQIAAAKKIAAAKPIEPQKKEALNDEKQHLNKLQSCCQAIRVTQAFQRVQKHMPPQGQQQSSSSRKNPPPPNKMPPRRGSQSQGGGAGGYTK